MNSDKIVITKYFKFEKPGPLVAIFSFKMSFGKYGEGYINDAKIFQKNNHHWVKLPDKEYTKDGQKLYSPLFGLLDKNGQALLEKDILQAIKDYKPAPKSSIPYPMTSSSPSVHKEEDDGNLPF